MLPNLRYPNKAHHRGKFLPKSRCAKCLYVLGFGSHRIGKIIDASHVSVMSWINRAGLKDPNRKILEDNRRKKLSAIRIANLPPKPVKIKKVVDPDYNKKKSLEYYYRHHEARKAKSRLNAKRVYESKKSDPLYVQKRRDLTNSWRINNPIKKAQSDRNWRKNNPIKVRALGKRSRSNPRNKLLRNIRRRVRDFLFKRESVLSTSRLCGCDRSFLISWIEKRFIKGMSWDNYGRWELDHIIPISRFDLTTDEGQRSACHYSNLQPLWREDNHAKADSILHPIQPELCMSMGIPPYRTPRFST